LKIPDGLGGVCWEAVFALKPGSPAFSVRRTLSTLERGLFAEPSSGPARVLCCVDGRHAESMVRGGWSRPQPTRRSPTPVTITNSPPGFSHEEFPILHLVGNAEESTTGCVFELGGDAAQMRPIDVRELFPRTQLCILQGPPLRVFDERRDGARRDANVVRWFAHDLHGRGMPAILVVPPLETQHGADVIGRIAAVLNGSQSFDRRVLIRTAAAIRAAILKMADLSPRDRWEISSDVSVYCPREWIVVLGGAAPAI
jgi:hypothetical protein